MAVKDLISRAKQSQLGRAIRNVVGNAAEGYRRAPTIQSPQALNQLANKARQFTQFTEKYNPIQILGKSAATSYAQVPGLVQNRQYGKALGKVAEGTGTLAAPYFAATAPVAAAVTGAIGGGISKASGGSFTQGAKDSVRFGAIASPIAAATNPYLAKLIPKSAGIIGSRVAPAVANVAQGIGIDQATGQQTTPLSLGIDALTGAVGGKSQFGSAKPRNMEDVLKAGKALGIDGVSPRVNKVHPEDLDVMREFADKIIRQKGAKQELGELGVSAQRLAEHYLGGKWRTADNKKLAQAFEWAIDLNMNIPREARGQLPKLGIAADQEQSVISQLRNQASTDPLIQEAKKYGSAEEFVKAQGIPVYRGGTDISKENITNAGISISKGRNVAEDFVKQKGGKVEEIVISPNAKIVDYSNIPNVKYKNLNDYSPELDNGNRQIWRDLEVEYQKAIDWAKLNGYDGVKLPLEGETRVINPDVLKTKSQLTDIYNQAKGVSSLANKPPVETKLSPEQSKLDPSLRIDPQGKVKSKDQPQTQRQQLKAFQRKKIKAKSTEGATGSGSSSKVIVTRDNKYAFNINKNKLQLDDESSKKMDAVVETMRPVLEKNKGRTLTKQEIVEGGRKAKVLEDVVGREEAKAFAESLQASRNLLMSEASQVGITPKFLEQLEVVSSVAADAGRRLQAFNVGAEDITIKERVLSDVLRAGATAEEILEEGRKIDWNNADQITAFYRKFKPATLAERLDEFRYTNMLSSPNTHINNAFSNLIQTAVLAPVEKTIRGALSFAESRLTGKEQEYFARQGVDYTRGYWKALPEAWSNFKTAFSSNQSLTKPDVNLIPTSNSKLRKLYTLPLQALEASDQFFRTLVKGGEIESLKNQGSKIDPIYLEARKFKTAEDFIKSKGATSLKDLSENYREIFKKAQTENFTRGITGAKATKMAEQQADYRTFRQAFDPDGKLGQNKVLQVWDKWNSAISNLRNVPGGKYLVPFLQTPTNILKQGLEYSPLGFVTAPGARDPMNQLAKFTVGSTVFTGAYALANSGLTTWDTPTNANERAEFYAAGLQPYSVKIGDKWVSYSKLGPLSYPIAMASALKWSQDNGGDEDLLAGAGQTMAGTLGFFADQSYVRGIGDMIDAVRGDEFKQARGLGNIPAQLVPYRSFMGWVARLVDPVYRKTSGGTIPQQIGKSLISQVPFASKSLEAYQTPFGTDSERQFPGINAVSPFSISQEKPAEKKYYDARSGLRKQEKEANKIIKEIEDGNLNVDTSKLLTKQAIDITKKKIEAGMEVTDQELETAYLDSVLTLPKSNRYEKGERDSKLWSSAGSIQGDENLSEPQKQALTKKIAKELGVTKDDLDLYQVAKQDNNPKTLYALDQIEKAQSLQEVISTLSKGRKPINGKVLYSDGVIDNLVQDGIIPYQLGKELKNLDLNEDGSIKKKKTSGGSSKKSPENKAISNYLANLAKISLPSGKIRTQPPVKINVSGLTFGS